MAQLFQRPQGRCGNCRHGWPFKEALTEARCPVCGSPNITVERVAALLKGQDPEETILDPSPPSFPGASAGERPGPSGAFVSAFPEDPPQKAGRSGSWVAPSSQASPPLPSASGSILPMEPFETNERPISPRFVEGSRHPSASAKLPASKAKAILPPPKRRSLVPLLFLTVVGLGSLGFGGWWLYNGPEAFRPTASQTTLAPRRLLLDPPRKEAAPSPRGCGHPKAKRPSLISPGRWTLYTCKPPKEAKTLWKHCLSKRVYLRSGLAACPGDALCCPPS